MKVLFCERTGDITLILKEDEEVKRGISHTPVLEAETDNSGEDDFKFFLMNPARIKDYIKVKEPRRNLPRFCIKISDKAYEDLLRNGRCGTRYGNSSKVNVIID